jgi:hemoglobin
MRFRSSITRIARMRRRLRTPPALALLAALTGPACQRGAPAGPEEPSDGAASGSVLESSKALYFRLGGVDGIRAVVDEMVGRMAADGRIEQFFVRIDFRRFKQQLVVQICELSGGPCRYRGRSMTQAHRGLRIRPAHFEAMIEDTRDALKAAQVGERERHELLSVLRGLKPEIVENPTEESR